LFVCLFVGVILNKFSLCLLIIFKLWAVDASALVVTELRFFHDSNEDYSYTQVAEMEHLFTEVKGISSPDFKGGAMWYRFKVLNSGNQPVGRALRVDKALYRNIGLFQLDSLGWVRSPILFPSSYSVPHIKLKAGQSRDYLLRIEFFSHAQFSPDFTTVEAMVENLFVSSGYRIASYFISIGLLALCFFVFSGGVVGGRYYFLVHVVSVVILLMVLGYDLKAIFNLDFSDYVLSLSMISVVFGIRFAGSFFTINSSSRVIYDGLSILSGIGIFGAAVFLFVGSPSLRWVVHLYFVVSCLAAILAILWRWQDEKWSAWLFAGAYFNFISHAFFYLAPSYGLMSPNNYTNNAMYTGFLIYLLLISAAIFLRFREHAEKLTEDLRSLNSFLEERVEEKVKEMEEQKLNLMNAAKAAGMADIAKAMIFQINNPLSVVLGYCRRYSLLKSKADVSSTDIAEIIGYIERAGHQIRSTIERLRILAVSEQSGIYDNIVVSRLFEDLKGLCDLMVEEQGIEFIVEIPPNSMRVNCVQGKIIRVLFQLVINAVDALSGEHEARITVAAREKKGMVEIAVEDTGSISDLSVIESLFTPFQGIKNGKQGLGLGLAAAKEIADEHNGSLFLKSADPTTFVLKIPVEQVLDKTA